MIERLLDDARHGRSGVLVLRGEPGIGKTTLLRHAEQQAAAMTILRATGLPSEAELEYSGLVGLLRPIVGVLDRLPTHQAVALREALGLGPPHEGGDRFAVGAALLGLLAAASDERPLLAVVDDAQWLDQASADALRFAARRLVMDRVAMLIAAREDEGHGFDSTGFETLDVGGLGLDEVADLLGRRGGELIPRAAMQRVHEATGGNPLAVIELGEMVPAGEVARRYDERSPMPVGPAIQRAFSRRSAALPAPSRRALLVVAVAMVADIDTVQRALTTLGLGLQSLEVAEDARLVSIDEGAVTFVHPLVRSAIYAAATASERRAAHRALANAAGALGDEDRRAWHLAGAAWGPDEEAASALAALGARSQERGGHAAAAAALEQSAWLTADRLLRLDRLTAAAAAAWMGGGSAKATALLDDALSRCDDLGRRVRLLSFRGRIEHEVGHQVKSRELLLGAADLIERAEPRAAASILLYSLGPSHYGGRGAEVLRNAERARALVPPDGSDLDARIDSFLGWALYQAGRGGEGAPILERTLGTLPASASRAQVRRAAISLSLLERAPEAEQMVQRVVALARREGPTTLSYALEQATRYAARSGDWDRAVASGNEGLALAEEIGTAADVANVLVTLARIDAARGREERCREGAAAAVEISMEHGLDFVLQQAHAALGLLDLGLGRYESAVEHLERVARAAEQVDSFTRDLTTEPDLVEALLALGRTSEARTWLEAYVGRGMRASPRWGAALVARCEGLLAPDDEALRHLRSALELHQAVPDRFQEARTQLCYGARLSRTGARAEGRERLRHALADFDALDAEPWTERTRTELRASGETIRRARHQVGTELTPQELQVALQVAEGKTNKEAAAALFLSPKTVEFHLGRVYPKLGVRSRGELIKRMTAVDPRELEHA